ncbi:MAG: hypothetical protein CMB82_04450 [Flammeovirgaceae bacterium]|nr:hypothetical protein [Flammeovirgaceae bacterium]
MSFLKKKQSCRTYKNILDRSKPLTFVLFLFILIGCNPNPEPKFKLVPSAESNINFENTLTENDTLNYFTYAYIYMGGGVSTGDINNDNLPDVFFTGNMTPNKLYLNQSQLKFEDISISAGITGDDRWYTGTTMVDVNDDGWLDIYVCVSGKFGNHKNQLFINNKDLTFYEAAEKYGIADTGQSIQASFFDYDKDGDLDMYLANYPSTSFKTPNELYKMYMSHKSPDKSDKLYQKQDDGTYKDVSEEAGILNFGLAVSASIADFNNDGWDDIYVSNDFSVPDFFYFNNQDGTFTEKIKEVTKQTSFYGMGTDAADINNDGLTDLFQVDMAAQDNRRQKANMASMNPDVFWSTVNSGFHYQYMYNSLQLNRGIVNGLPVFSNTAWISNISSTDWSWCPIFVDLDNDGNKDLYVTNGTRREINNKDYFNALDKLEKQVRKDSSYSLASQIPEEPIDNYVFKNIGNARFKQTNEEWGLKYKGFSNGAAYADFDLDGDMDLIINNIDSKSVLFENKTSQASSKNYLIVKLKGGPKNRFGLSSKLTLRTNEGIQTKYITTSRGFQSSVEPLAHFGLGSSFPKKLKIEWSNGDIQFIDSLIVNSTMTFDKINTSQKIPPQSISNQPLFEDITKNISPPFFHWGNMHNDFKYQVLLPHKMSEFSPGMAIGDLNNDGMEDVFVGSSTGYPAKIYLQNSNGSFFHKSSQIELDAIYEDLGAVIFDVDRDGDNDLYVVSGGNILPSGDPLYQDRLYINEKGELNRAPNALPKIYASGSRVIAKDYDLDGDLDLVIGGRLEPQSYPNPGQSIFLENVSSKNEPLFQDVTKKIIPDLKDIAMTTDLAWADLDLNGKEELIVVGEWSKINVFEWSGDHYEHSTAYDLGEDQGWWFNLTAKDIDHDGDIDLIGGNLGLNYKYQANEKEPFDLYVNDFDKNKSPDLVLSYYNNGAQFPVRGRQCSSQQIPAIKYKFNNYNSFSTASLEDIYGKRDLENALHLQVKSFSSKIFINQGNKKFEVRDLPLEAQYAPINDIIVTDVNEDGNEDLIIAGNLYSAEVETPRADAGIGLILIGDGKGNFKSLTLNQSGLLLNHDIKDLAYVQNKETNILLAASNRGPLKAFALNKN